MSTWNDEKHEAARARWEAATQGPWESCGGAIEGGPTSGRDVVTTEVDCMSYCYGGKGRGVEHPEDRDFIAHAYTDIPELLDEIERLRALTAITNNMVETALNAWFYDELDGIYEGFPDDTTARMRAALEAVLTPKENEA